MAPELLQGYLEAAAARRAGETAITLGAESVTFAELEESSTRLARLLIEAGCERGDRVCLMIPKSPTAVMAMHAVMKADCCYVPIDLANPPARAAR